MASSKQYGKALFEITEELGTTEQVLADMQAVRALMSASAEYPKLLDTPAVPKEERVELIEKADSQKERKPQKHQEEKKGFFAKIKSVFRGKGE